MVIVLGEPSKFRSILDTALCDAGKALEALRHMEKICSRRGTYIKHEQLDVEKVGSIGKIRLEVRGL
uniref:Uncharacterized protein n=1 Tax=Peronospora matthiolae TaxID=2874970 RepID=A0AAV1TMN2_9STRA